MPSPTLTRRAMIAGTGTAVASTALAVPYVNAALPEKTDDEVDGLIGLPLAAVHIERAIAAMAPVTMGRWQVTITSGDANQWWGFKQINPNRVDPLIEAIAKYREGMAAYDTHEIVHRVDYTMEEHDAAVAETYGRPRDALVEWLRPAITTAGVDAALDLALAASREGDTEVAHAMIVAARGYVTAA